MITKVDNEKISKLIEQVSQAQTKYKNFSQKQVDKIFKAAAVAGCEARITLADAAHNETGMGIPTDKVIKNHFASEFIYNKFRDTQTVGVFHEDRGLGIRKIYAPVGVIGAVIPTTNPTSTAMFKILIALKTGNGIIVSPHPGAKNCVKQTVDVLTAAAEKAGAPKGLIAFIEDGTLDDTKALMVACDLIIATGGGGMVRAAYSSGTPALGVGAGNCPVIIDNTADLDLATSAIVQSNTFDNGLICATENSVIVHADVYDEVVALFKKKWGHVITKKDELDKIRKVMFKEGRYGLLNPALVGQSATKVAELAGIKVPALTTLLLCETKKTSYDEPLAHEKLSTYVALYKAQDIDEAIQISEDLLLMGPGHTASMFADEFVAKDKITAWSNRLNAGRMVVNQPSSLGAVGDVYNFDLAPSLTLGCGTWGGNSTSEPIQPKHLLNIKTVAIRREKMQWMRLPNRIYHKFGCLPFALNDLKEWKCKKVLVISDSIINQLYGKKLTDILDNLNIEYFVYTDIEPNPTIATIKRAVKTIKEQHINHDAIIAYGGGSVMDAAKMIRLLDDYPDVNFKELAMTFINIRNRIVKFPTFANSAKLICIPTTSGTGSEVTPFSVITDGETEIKYPLADYALTPDMAIIDPELTLTTPKFATSAPALDALTHSFEAYVSVLSTDYTDPYCLQSINNFFTYLPDAYHKGADAKLAKTKVANSATQAGMAFANAYLGIVHSMSHKVGGHFGVIHGAANSILLPYVIRYNAGVVHDGGKQAYYSGYKTANTCARYAEIARHCGIKGSTDEELVNKLVKKVQNLSKDVELPATFKEYFKKFGLKVTEEEFLAALPEMANNAFDDQCTPANPRACTREDLQQIYKDAYYGTPIKAL